MRQAAALLLAAAALLGFGGGASAAVPSIPAFDQVIVVVFENKETSSVLGSRAAPTFNLYGRVYARMTRYYAVGHPSLPNYPALVSGSTFGVATDVAARTLPNFAFVVPNLCNSMHDCSVRVGDTCCDARSDRCSACRVRSSSSRWTKAGRRRAAADT
jgi:hypothetical protein